MQKSYWFGIEVPPSEYSPINEVEAAEDEDAQSDKEFFEAEPQGLARTVEIKGLKKVNILQLFSMSRVRFPLNCLF